MCQFFSCIVLKNKVLFDKDIDNHTNLLEKYNIKDDSQTPNFVRVELTPPTPMRLSAPISNWMFRVDQDFRPEWFDEIKARRMTEKALASIFDQVVVTNGHFDIYSGRCIAVDSASVEAFGSASVEAFDSASVKAFDSASVKACGSASVKACGSASVEACGSASVIAGDSASVHLSDRATNKPSQENVVEVAKGTIVR